MTVAPNPAYEFLRVTADWNFDAYNVIDSSGRVVRTQKVQTTRSTNIPLQGLSPGSYYFLVSRSENRAKQSFIVPLHHQTKDHHVLNHDSKEFYY